MTPHRPPAPPQRHSTGFRPGQQGGARQGTQGRSRTSRRVRGRLGDARERLDSVGRDALPDELIRQIATALTDPAGLDDADLAWLGLLAHDPYARDAAVPSLERDCAEGWVDLWTGWCGPVHSAPSTSRLPSSRWRPGSVETARLHRCVWRNWSPQGARPGLKAMLEELNEAIVAAESVGRPATRLVGVLGGFPAALRGLSAAERARQRRSTPSPSCRDQVADARAERLRSAQPERVWTRSWRGSQHGDRLTATRTGVGEKRLPGAGIRAPRVNGDVDAGAACHGFVWFRHNAAGAFGRAWAATPLCTAQFRRDLPAEFVTQSAPP